LIRIHGPGTASDWNLLRKPAGHVFNVPEYQAPALGRAIKWHVENVPHTLLEQALNGATFAFAEMRHTENKNAEKRDNKDIEITNRSHRKRWSSMAFLSRNGRQETKEDIRPDREFDETNQQMHASLELLGHELHSSVATIRNALGVLEQRGDDAVTRLVWWTALNLFGSCAAIISARSASVPWEPWAPASPA
jgi:hypothetical protein